MIKFDNILKFATLFLSGDLNLKQQSPDYIMEKFETFFGKNIKIKKHTSSNILYKENNKIWKHNDYRINSIFNFLYDVLNYSKNSQVDVCPTPSMKNIRCEPVHYIELFNKWIGDFSDIHNEDNGGVHPVLIRDMYNVYFNSIEEENEIFFLKLDRKEKLKKF